ncbi:MAG: DUF2818 family protein [Methylophilaceae bacterium]
MLGWLIILLSIVVANLPWLTDSFFLCFSLKKKKSILVTLIELIIFYFIIGSILLLIEYQVIGNIHNQDWEFYAVTFILFVVFSFPGFIYKIIWK